MGQPVVRLESDRETVFREGSRTCRSFNALDLITVIITVVITVIITATIVGIIVAMIKYDDHDHHFFGHLALVDQERQVVQGSPTQKFELAIRTCDVKNKT